MRLMLESFRHDIRSGMRMLLRNPAFSGVALLTLALGIGANTAIFSVVNAVLLRSLPYPNPDRLVVLDEFRLQHGHRSVSWMDFRDWRAQNHVFDDMAAYRLTDVTLTGRDGAARLRAGEVSSAFFRLLGTQPAAGRFFTEENDAPGAAPTVVISHDFWKSRLGGARDIVGTPLALNGSSYAVIGVLPATFAFFDRRVDVYLPVGLHGEDPEWLRRGNHPNLLVLAGLRQGVSVDSARAAFDVIMRRLEKDYPQSNAGLTATVTGLDQFTVGSSRGVLVTLLASAGCILLIACANVANLLLSRSSARRREVAIRAAMGADRWRLGRQVIVESLVLSLAGGILGVGLAAAALPIVSGAAPGILPRVRAITIDSTVLAFTLAVSVGSALLFGCAPAIQAASGDLSTVFNETGRSGGAGRRGHRARSALLVGEIAIALVLLTSAGLLVRSLANAMRVDPGFDAEHLLMLELTIPPGEYAEPESRVLLLTQAVERLKTVAGVRTAGAAQCPPLSGVCVDTAFMLADRPVASVVDLPTAASNIVAPGYFEAMHVRLLSGRLFLESDTRQRRPVAIVNESFAAHHWPQGDAVGKQIREGGPQGNQPYREIIGVVTDIKQNGLDAESRPEVFLPMTQFPFAPWTELNEMTFVVRTAGDPAAVASSARQELRALDKNLPVSEVRTMTRYVSESLARRRFATQLLTAFALLALLLAAIGTYGVMAYTVSQRRHEIGVRMALGATRPSIRALVLRRSAWLSGMGIVTGWAGSFVSTRWLASALFGVGPTDPITFAAVAAVLLAVAALASLVPAQRAIRIEPAMAVRAD